MKKRQKKLTWVHPLYAILVVVVLFVALQLRPGMLFSLTILGLALIVCISSYIHYKNATLKRDTLIEYILTALAAAAVLIGAIRH